MGFGPGRPSRSNGVLARTARRAGEIARGVPWWLWIPLRCAALLLAVSAVTFFLVGVSPIDPVQANVGQSALLAMSAEKRAALAEYWGVGEPIAERFARWLSAALHGDLGYSLRFNAPVVEVVGERFAASSLLLITAWLLSGALGFVLGLLAGSRRGSWIDRFIKSCCYLLSATPAFWIALLVLMVFAVYLGWFPIGFSTPIGVAAQDVGLADKLHHIVLPALTLALTGVAPIALHTREKCIDVMQGDYMRFAESRGESRRQVLCRHGLRNIALPAVMLHLASLSEIFGGSILIEQVFSYPGLGQAAVTAGLGGDAPLLVGIALASALLVFSGNVLADALAMLMDPRMRKGAHRG